MITFLLNKWFNQARVNIIWRSLFFTVFEFLTSEPPESVCSHYVQPGSNQVCGGLSRPLLILSCGVWLRNASLSSAWWLTWSPATVFAGSLSFLESLKYLDAKDNQQCSLIKMSIAYVQELCGIEWKLEIETHHFSLQHHAFLLDLRFHHLYGARLYFLWL